MLEVIVASALALLLLTVLIFTLIPLARVSMRGYQRMAMTQSALVACTKLSTDLQSSTLVGVGLPSNPTVAGIQYVSVQPLNWVTDQGTRVWTQSLFLYRWDPVAQTFVRKQWPPQPPALPISLIPDGPTALTPDQFTQIFGQLNGTEQTLATSVTQFSLGLQSNGSQPLSLQLKVEQPVPGLTTTDSFTITRQFYLRNNG